MLRRMITTTGLSLLVALPVATWIAWYMRGKTFALRDRLQKADAIVTAAGTRGNIEFLDSKVRTAVHLYKQGWAPLLIFTGRFSAAVTDTPQLIPVEELELAVTHGRLEQRDIPRAAVSWDTSLGAHYMREQAIKLGVPAEAIIAEDQSLHTLENAKFTACILHQKQAARVILVTSPFHQLRTFLTFSKVLQNDHIEIANYYADTGEWNPITWFFSSENRQLVSSELSRIQKYRAKGDIL